MSYPAIASLVPHAAPMLLLDRLCEATATTARCEVRVGETLALFLREQARNKVMQAMQQSAEPSKGEPHV